MHSLRVLWAIPNACRDPFALTRCLQRGTVDSARSPLTHHRPLVDLNAHYDECCTGPKWRVHAHTHENASCAWFDHSHTRPKACRAPFGWGSTRQAKRRASHLGHTRELLAREHAHIGGRRQADILIRQFLNDVHARSRHFYAERLQGFQDEDSPVSRTCYLHSVSRLGRCLCGRADPFGIV